MGAGARRVKVRHMARLFARHTWKRPVLGTGRGCCVRCSDGRQLGALLLTAAGWLAATRAKRLERKAHFEAPSGDSGVARHIGTTRELLANASQW
ncbi:hypothetical protein MRX96_024041 [Rhipicephalus microplus]